MEKLNRRYLQGTVVSNKMEKTIVVAVKIRKMHPLYKKFIASTKKILVHDSTNEAQVGDVVGIRETRPLSRHKRWEKITVIKKVQ